MPGQRGFMSDRVSRIMGYAIMRQNRVQRSIKTNLNSFVEDNNIMTLTQDDKDFCEDETTEKLILIS